MWMTEYHIPFTCHCDLGLWCISSILFEVLSRIIVPEVGIPSWDGGVGSLLP